MCTIGSEKIRRARLARDRREVRPGETGEVKCAGVDIGRRER